MNYVTDSFEYPQYKGSAIVPSGRVGEWSVVVDTRDVVRNYIDSKENKMNLFEVFLIYYDEETGPQVYRDEKVFARDAEEAKFKAKVMQAVSDNWDWDRVTIQVNTICGINTGA